MEAAEAQHLCLVLRLRLVEIRAGEVGRRRVGVEAKSVNSSGPNSSADLGGSSKYSSENLEDRRGEGFHVNSSWT
jgi:hypothetical protein